MAADKRTPRRGGGGFSGGGGGGGRGRPGGGGGGRPGGWQPRPPGRQGGGRPSGPPERGGREAAPWADRAPSRGPARPVGASAGRWEAVEAESLDEMAAALNSLGVQPEHLVHLVAHVIEGEEGAQDSTEGWEALVWVG
jgi:hypothetical protein